MRSCTTQPQTQQRPVRLSTVVPHRISRQRNVCKAANANGAGELKFGRARVMDLLAQGYSNYNRPEEFDVAIDQLIKENPTQDLAKESFTLGQGCWQVFYAPHISKLSSAMAARFEPIQYTLEGTKLLSNVKYAHPLLGEGWLSSGGSMLKKYDDTVEVAFDRFWVDVGPASLRADVPRAAELSMNADAIVSALGRAAFFPQFAVFPVLYLDAELCVFKFPPLDSLIAVRKVQ